MQQFDADLISRAKVVDATSAGTVVFELDVGEEYSNNAGMLPPNHHAATNSRVGLLFFLD